MSISTATTDVPNAMKGQNKPSAAPKKFVFNVDLSPTKSCGSSGSTKGSKTLQAQLNIPSFENFLQPDNFKEAYESLCESLLKTLEKIKEIVIKEFSENIPEITKDLQFVEPRDCVTFLERTVLKSEEKLKNLSNVEDPNSMASAYEQLLQKAEIKIRDLIRNEQMYRITFEQYNLRYEESEKIIADLKGKIEEGNTKIEDLTRETAKLMSIIRKKDEKIRCLLIEKHSLNPGELSEFPSPLLVATDRSLITDQNKIQLRNLNLKDLKVFLHSNRPTLSETNRMTPNPESSRVISNVNKSGFGFSPGFKQKSSERSGKSLGNMAFTNLKINAIEKSKEGRDLSQQRVKMLTDRKKETLAANEKSLEGFSFTVKGTHKVSNSQLQDGQKTKSPNAKIDLSKSNKNKSLHSVRTRPKEDVSGINFKTEPSEDQMTLSVALERTEKRKDNVELQKVTPKSSNYQPLNIKRKTTTFKERAVTEMSDFQDKSMESRNMKNKFNVNSFLSYKSLSKEKSPKIENKDNRGGQNSSIFMNIMLKKLASQKSQSKKTL